MGGAPNAVPSARRKRNSRVSSAIFPVAAIVAASQTPGGFAWKTRLQSVALPSFHVGGEIDLAAAAELGAQLEAVIDASIGVVAVDLAEVTFLDSSGLKAHVAAQRRLHAEADA